MRTWLDSVNEHQNTVTATIQLATILIISAFTAKSALTFQPGGVLRFELDRGVPLEPQNPYPSLRVILAEKGAHF